MLRIMTPFAPASPALMSFVAKYKKYYASIIFLILGSLFYKFPNIMKEMMRP